MNDAAVDALRAAIEQGFVATVPSLFLRARVGLPNSDDLQLLCEQSFAPWAFALRRRGYRTFESVEVTGTTYGQVLILAPRQREEARSLLARATLSEAHTIVASQRNDEGARPLQSDFERLFGEVEVYSKHHCRVLRASTRSIDLALRDEWLEADAPRLVCDGRYWSRPGLFAWDRIDPASQLLVDHLPDDLHGTGADLGAGFGFIADTLLSRHAAIDGIDLHEAEHRALALAQRNLDEHGDRARYAWTDVTQGLSRRYDFIVTNPPFHQSRDDDPSLGRAFIEAAADALVPRGRLFLVANRHLPYEATLRERFAASRVLAQGGGFKIVEATAR